MLTTLGAALVALACVGAAARRLAWAVAPIGLEPRVLFEALEGERAFAVAGALRSELSSDPRFAWERNLLFAFDEPEGPKRDALVNEQLLDFEGRTDRWVRAPRVCASIGTSVGLFFGSIALLQGIALPEGEEAAGAIREALSSALGAVSLGIAATSFCIAIQGRAARSSKDRRAAIDALVERLRCVSDSHRRSA